MLAPHAEKRVTALRAAMALAYMALVSQHRVSLLSLGEGLRRESQPLKGQGHIHRLREQLAALEFGGETDLVGSLRQFRPARDRRGLVFVISDLFGAAPETATAALLQATRWPAETHVIHVLHPHEMRPTWRARFAWSTWRRARRGGFGCPAASWPATSRCSGNSSRSCGRFA